MNFAFEMGINVLESALILAFLIRYFGFRRSSPIRYWGTLIIWCISFALISFFSWTHLYESYASSLQIVVNIIFCCWLLSGTIFQKVFLSVFTMGLIAMIATTVALLLGALTQNHVSYLLSEHSAVRMIGVIFSKLAFFAITETILRIKQSAKLRLRDALPLIIVPALSIIAITLMMNAAIDAPEVQTYVFYSVCSIFVLNVFIYYLFVRLARTEKMELELALLNLQNACMQQKTQEIQHMYDHTCSLRHDMKNHLQCISSLAHQENATAIRAYTNNLLQQQAQSEEVIVFSGNHTLDAIVGAKCSTAKQLGVKLQAVITTALSEVAPEDICVLLGNALDNAIRAATQSESKKIDLFIQPQGNYVAITVSNSVNQTVLRDNPNLNTSKADRKQHGYGIKNMQKVVDKYQGIMQFYEQEQQFFCDILLCVPSRKQGTHVSS